MIFGITCSATMYIEHMHDQNYKSGNNLGLFQENLLNSEQEKYVGSYHMEAFRIPAGKFN
jgi:hypothetical protein